MAEESIKHYLRSLDVNEKLISNIDNGIIILDNNLHIHYYNRWLEVYTSLKESDLLEKSICDVFPNINEKTLTRKIKTALSMGTPTFYTANISKYLIPIEINRLNISGFEHMRQDVSIIPFDTKKRLVSLIITDQTNITNTNVLLEANILKVQDLNTQLIKERETIDKKVILLKFDNEHTITNTSYAYLQLMSYEQSDVLDSNYFQYQKRYIDVKLKEEILIHIEEKKVFEFENRTITQDGRTLILKHTLVPEYDTRAKQIGFILFMEDITSTKTVIKQQEKLLTTSRSAAMGDMISMIAHQWRQPLSVINTIIATLKVKQELSLLEKDDINNSFSKIENTVKYLSDTIDDFRDYFKPNKDITNVLVTNLIEKSTTFIIHEMKVQEIDFRINIEEELSLKTYQNELMQCIINILSNSLDAFKDIKKQEKEISLSATNEPTHISLKFKDNAGGIKKNIIKKIFDPYFSTKEKNGTGLGLYMTKKIIEEHLKGKITVQSAQSQTTIIIELPHEILKEIK